MPPTTELEQPAYCRASDIPARFPELFTQRQWEWLMRNRKNNGLCRATRKIGKRLYINIPVLLDLLEESEGA